MFVCPKCGEETETLHEGYCEPCREEGQRALDEHNANYGRWMTLSDRERDREIRRSALVGAS